MELRADPGARQPCRALAQRKEGRDLRAGERRLGRAGRQEQVQGVAELRESGRRLYRPAGPRGPGGVPEYQDSTLALGRRADRRMGGKASGAAGERLGEFPLRPRFRYSGIALSVAVVLALVAL